MLWLQEHFTRPVCEVSTEKGPKTGVLSHTVSKRQGANQAEPQGPILAHSVCCGEHWICWCSWDGQPALSPVLPFEQQPLVNVQKKHWPRRKKTLKPTHEGLKSHHWTHTLTAWMSSAEVVKLNSLYGHTKEKQTFLKMPFNLLYTSTSRPKGQWPKNDYFSSAASVAQRNKFRCRHLNWVRRYQPKCLPCTWAVEQKSCTVLLWDQQFCLKPVPYRTFQWPSKPATVQLKWTKSSQLSQNSLNDYCAFFLQSN